MTKVILAFVLAVFSVPAFASVSNPAEACKKEVAMATIQLINAVSAAEKTAALDAKPSEVEHEGKSATVYLIPASLGGADTITAGSDVWSSPVHRSIGKKKDTFLIETTTQNNRAGECRVLSMTIVDHITGR